MLADNGYNDLLFRMLNHEETPGTHGMRHLAIDSHAIGDIDHIRTTIHTLYGEVNIEKLPNENLPRITIPGGCKIHFK